MTSRTDRLLARIDEDLRPATAPSSDTDYGFGSLTEKLAQAGLCWKCGRRPAEDELAGSALCQRCRWRLLDEQGPDPDWAPLDLEAPGWAFGRRLGRHRCALDGCRCGGILARELEAFDLIRRHTAPPPPKMAEPRRIWRLVAAVRAAWAQP